MHPAVVLLLGCATAAAQDSLAVCDLNTDLPESIGTVNLKFSESVMVHNNLGGKGGKDAHNDDDPHEIRRAALPSPRIYPRSTNLTPALRRTRRLSNIARLQVLDAAITDIPRAAPMRATAWPMRPRPTTPSVRPASSVIGSSQ